MLLREPVDALPAALRTGQPEHPPYLRIRALHLHDGEPYGVMDSYVARETYARFPAGSDERHKIGYRSASTTASRWTRPARNHRRLCRPETADLLAGGADCSMADMLVRVRRWWTARDGRIAYAGLYLYRADRFVLDVTHDLTDGDGGHEAGRSIDWCPPAPGQAAGAHRRRKAPAQARELACRVFRFFRSRKTHRASCLRGRPSSPHIFLLPISVRIADHSLF